MLNKTERKLYPPNDCIYYHVELYTMRNRNGIIISYNTTESSKSPPAFEEVIRLPKLRDIYSKPKPNKNDKCFAIQFAISRPYKIFKF